MNKTLILIKPDAVRRKLIGKIIARFELEKLEIVEMKKMTILKEMAEKHYGEHKEKDFFLGLIDFITSGPIVAIILGGIEDIVPLVRKIVGATNPNEAEPGTIRHDLKDNPATTRENMVHASDSPASAKREINFFFR